MSDTTLQQVLSNHKLVKYVSALVDEGYDDLEFLQTRTEDQLLAIGRTVAMPIGHSERFAFAIQESLKVSESVAAEPAQKRPRHELLTSGPKSAAIPVTRLGPTSPSNVTKEQQIKELQLEIKKLEASLTPLQLEARLKMLTLDEAISACVTLRPTSNKEFFFNLHNRAVPL